MEKRIKFVPLSERTPAQLTRWAASLGLRKEAFASVLAAAGDFKPAVFTGNSKEELDDVLWGKKDLLEDAREDDGELQEGYVG